MKRIQLKNGLEAIVDDEDYNELIKYNWYGNKSRDIIYVKRKTRKLDNRNEKIISMHRQLMGFPEGRHIDHINNNGLDNRRCNLRICNNSQNMWNRKRRLHNNNNEFKGVSWFKRLRKWRASISLTIGYFDSKEEAAKAYDEAAKRLFGEFANLNYSEKEIVTKTSR
jgi:hypothetical protein